MRGVPPPPRRTDPSAADRTAPDDRGRPATPTARVYPRGGTPETKEGRPTPDGAGGAPPHPPPPHRIPVTGQVPVILTTLKKALCAALPDQASLLNPVPELPLAQAFIIVELWVSALLDHKHRLKDDVLVSPPIWTGCDLLVLLTSYRDPAVVPAGRVGVLLSSRQSSIPEAAAVPLPRLKEEWCADPWLSFDLCPRCDRPRLQRLVLTQPCDPARPPVMPVCGALPKGSTVTRRMARCSNIRVSGLSGASAFSLSTAACHLCSPGVCDLQPPGDDNLYRQLRARHDGSYIPKFDALPTGITRLLVFTINAGGLASKMRMLLALLVDFEPDVVCLQEAGPLFVDDSLKGVPYRVILGPVVPTQGGGGAAGPAPAGVAAAGRAHTSVPEQRAHQNSMEAAPHMTLP